MKNKDRVYFCEVTGLPVTEKRKWCNVLVNENYSTSFRLLGERILISAPCGDLRHCDFEKQYSLRNRFIDEEIGTGEPFVEITDYSKVFGVPARKVSRIRRDLFLRDAGRVLKFVGFNMSGMIRTRLILGLAFNRSPYPFELKSSYLDAVTSAFRTMKSYDLETLLKKENLRFDKKWEYHGSGLAVRIGIIDEWIMSGSVEGDMCDEDIVPVIALQQSVLTGGFFTRKRYYRIIDLSKAKIRGLGTNIRYRAELRRMLTKYGRPLATLHVGNGDVVGREILSLSGVFSRTFVPGLDDAFEKIREMESGKRNRTNSLHLPLAGWFSGIRRRIGFEDKYSREIEELYYTIGSFSWDTDDTRFPRVSHGHPFRKIYDSLELLWIDLKSILREQDQQKRELEDSRKRAEQANIAKSEFLANMSHEIRTPMNGILGMLDLLNETRLSREQKILAESASASADSLLRILNDVLDYSKIEACKMSLEEIGFNLRSVVGNVGDLLSISAIEKKVEFNFFIEPGLPEMLLGDPGRLRQILINLGGNAIKFVDSGEVTIWVSCAEETDLSASILFEVRDTGIGIAGDKLDDLFKPFSQGDSTTTRKYGGTGLGLSITKQITELMNGEIRVQSQPGMGSVFYVKIPFRKQKDAFGRGEKQFKDFKGLRVLVVEKHETSRTIMAKYLDSWGCRVDSVSTGRSAVLFLERSSTSGDPYSLLFAGEDLGDMKGRDLFRKTKEKPGGDRLKTVLITPGWLNVEPPGTEDECILCRLAKPVRRSVLYEFMVSVMEKGSDSNVPDSGTESENIFSAAENSMTILVAEDNRMNQKVLSRMIASMGHRCRIAENGHEALEMFKTGRFDMILMDGNMPVMDGIQAAREIRAHERECGAFLGIPIIAVTANAMMGDRKRFLDAGMDDYLAKPVKKKELEKLISGIAQGMDGSIAGTVV